MTSFATGCGGDDDEAIDLPTAAEPTTSERGPAGDSNSGAQKKRTITVKLFTGETVRIDFQCSLRLDIASRKKEAVAAARQLPPLKQTVLNRRRDFRTFLRQHPENELASAAYQRYQELRASQSIAVKAYNAKVRKFNLLADRYNGALRACKM
jgi:hypothetical protein